MKLKESLSNAMKDERGAPGDYRKLRSLLLKKKDKKLISGIISDEQRHLRLLKKIKRKELK